MVRLSVASLLALAVGINVAHVGWRGWRQALPAAERRAALIASALYYTGGAAFVAACADAWWSPEAGLSAWQVAALVGLIGVGLWVLSGRGVAYFVAFERALQGREPSMRRVRVVYGYVSAVSGALSPLVWRLMS